MKVLRCGLLGCVLAFCGQLSQPLVAQESELDLPEMKMVVGLGEMTEDGKLKLSFGSGNAPRVPVVEVVKQTYTVMIPYTETEKIGGKDVEVTKHKTEERTRDVSVTRMMVQKEISVKVAGLKCYSISGQPIGELDLRDHFAGRQPVVVITTGGIVNEFFSQVFADDVMVVELPESVMNPPPQTTPAGVPGLRRPTVRPLVLPAPKRIDDGESGDGGKGKKTRGMQNSKRNGDK